MEASRRSSVEASRRSSVEVSHRTSVEASRRGGHTRPSSHAKEEGQTKDDINFIDRIILLNEEDQNKVDFIDKITLLDEEAMFKIIENYFSIPVLTEQEKARDEG